MGRYDYIEQNLLRLNRKLDKICTECGRNPKEIYLIAVSKTFPSDAVASALDFNQLEFGENRVQELLEKHEALSDRILNWHLIGHLQTNKVKFVVPFVKLIHSVDTTKLALKINDEAKKCGKHVKCLVQVNTSDEMQKSGCDVRETVRLVKEMSIMENVRVQGLMTIAKFMDDEKSEHEQKIVRENFRTLKNLFDEICELKIPNVEMKYLSMGMSSDYRIAIEEGSNMLRLGTAIFGERSLTLHE